MHFAVSISSVNWRGWSRWWSKKLRTGHTKWNMKHQMIYNYMSDQIWHVYHFNFCCVVKTWFNIKATWGQSVTEDLWVPACGKLCSVMLETIWMLFIQEISYVNGNICWGFFYTYSNKKKTFFEQDWWNSSNWGGQVSTTFKCFTFLKL